MGFDHKRIYLVIGLLLLSLITGCAEIQYVKDAPEKVKAADWSKMQTITVSLTEYKFTPSELSFRKDIPYRLILKNEGREKHYFVSEGFFRAIALRKVQTSDGEIKAPYITAVEVYPEKSVEIYFIPDKLGTYDLICTIEGHADKGMRGKIEIKDGELKAPEMRWPYRY
ncbi:MAG: cupredoxin domain-containing protein [Thermodesulfovibrionales bacterium]